VPSHTESTKGPQELLVTLQRNEIQNYDIKISENGIVEMRKYSELATPEAKFKLHVGDKILKVNDFDSEHFRNVLKNTAETTPIRFLVRRTGQKSAPSLMNTQNGSESATAQARKDWDAFMSTSRLRTVLAKETASPTAESAQNNTGTDIQPAQPTNKRKLPSPEKNIGVQEPGVTSKLRCLRWGCPNPPTHGFNPAKPTMCAHHKLTGHVCGPGAQTEPKEKVAISPRPNETTPKFHTPSKVFVKKSEDSPSIESPREPNKTSSNNNNPFPGWVRSVSYRSSGVQAGKADVYFKPPDDKKLRSRPDIIAYYTRKGMQDSAPYFLRYFNWNATFCVCKTKSFDPDMKPCQLGAGGCNGFVHPACVKLDHLTDIQWKANKFICEDCQKYSRDSDLEIALKRSREAERSVVQYASEPSAQCTVSNQNQPETSKRGQVKFQSQGVSESSDERRLS